MLEIQKLVFENTLNTKVDIRKYKISNVLNIFRTLTRQWTAT